MKYARVLVENCPKKTTQLFIQYFTGRFQPKKDELILETRPQQSGYTTGAVNAVQNLKGFLPLSYTNTTVSQSVTDEVLRNNTVPKDTDVIFKSDYIAPQPRKAFSSFVDHPDEFIEFLEACLEEKCFEERDKIDLYTALFEMYLHKSNEDGGAHREAWEVKAKKLIENKENPIDTSNILLLSHLSNFRDGSILVREQAGLRLDIFRSYTSAKDTHGAINALKKYGPEEPHLYPAALAYFCSDSKVLADAEEELDAVLKKIDHDGLMAPLEVIQTLSTNSVTTMGMVKNYLQQIIERERKEITSNRRLIESYRAETLEKRKEISDLITKPQVFNNSRCQFCGSQLSLPIVHFLCKHSFHQSCLNMTVERESGAEINCPTCKKDNDTIRAIRKAQDENSDRHDLFLDALERSDDRFGTISEFFGRGLMNNATIE